MKRLFADTGGWMMLADADDPLHAAASAARDRWLQEGGTFVTTDFVLDETLTLLRLRLGMRAAKEWWSRVEGSARVEWEWIDPSRAERARDWFFRWDDKDFSFTDCTSFVVMRERKLTVALTSDGDFVQAGFEILPPPASKRLRRRRRS